MITRPQPIGPWRSLYYPYHALDDIVDVGEIPPHVAVVVHVDGASLQYSLCELEVGHIRASPGAVDGKKPQARGRQAVEVAVGVSHQLVGLLCGRIEAHRMIRIVVHRERYLGIRAVDRARRGEHQVPNAPVTAAFEDVYEARQVAL